MAVATSPFVTVRVTVLDGSFVFRSVGPGKLRTVSQGMTGFAASAPSANTVTCPLGQVTRPPIIGDGITDDVVVRGCTPIQRNNIARTIYSAWAIRATGGRLPWLTSTSKLATSDRPKSSVTQDDGVGAEAVMGESNLRTFTIKAWAAILFIHSVRLYAEDWDEHSPDR